ncbi:hypothetical protein M0P48_01725 [Candidatus Gracilibacteria bacterium]|nr:hypothetical protein [Candidatus Gracilibacteria bacterium]
MREGLYTDSQGEFDGKPEDNPTLPLHKIIANALKNGIRRFIPSLSDKIIMPPKFKRNTSIALDHTISEIGKAGTSYQVMGHSGDLYLLGKSTGETMEIIPIDREIVEKNFRRIN